MLKVPRPSFPLTRAERGPFYLAYSDSSLTHSGFVLVTFKVKTIGAFKQIIGSREIELSMQEGTTLEQVFMHLTERWGDELQSKLFEPGTTTPFPYIRIMVNGQDIAFLNRMGTELQEGDEVLILPPAYGG